MATFEVDPISRIEGHLGVKVTVGSGTAAGLITEANAHGNLWRGFENFLVGRRANDAITFTQRICGVCPVPHGTASMYAVESVLGVSEGYMTFAEYTSGSNTYGVPKAAVHIRNMILASEFLMSSITHFYHLAAQSYIQGPAIPPWTPYFPDGQYNENLRNTANNAVPQCTAGVPNELWSAVIKQYVKALRIRRLCLEAGALFAGRMPMTSTLVAGGVTNVFKNKTDFVAKCDAFHTLMTEVGKFVVTEYIPLALALGALYPDWDNNQLAANVQGFGAGVGNFLAWGGFPGADDAGTLAVAGGYKLKAGAATKFMEHRADLPVAMGLVETKLKEFITCSRYANTHGYEGTESQYPGKVTRTEPRRDDADAYSWLKAPRWDGQPMEVGPLARMVVNGWYLVGGERLVDFNGAAGSIPKAYADLYLTDATHLNTSVVHGDLVAGLNTAINPGGNLLATVQTYITGLRGGLSTMDRLRARALESYWMIRFLIGVPTPGANPDALTFVGNGWVDDLKALWTGGENTPPKFYRNVATPVGSVSGYGLHEAPRGALGHFVTASAGKIEAYQCVVPTTWNASPKDGTGAPGLDNSGTTKRGPMEQAMIGVNFDPTVSATGHGAAADRISGVEVLRVAQSFDPCIACAVH
jgi:hydrogenase large subunit